MLHIFSIVIIIWNLFGFRRELQLDLQQMYTAYLIIITWRCDRRVTWHVMLGLFILATTLLSFWAFRLVKVKIKFFRFFTWPFDWCITSLEWGLLIWSLHPARFGVQRPCESENITSLICYVTIRLRVRCVTWPCVGFPSS